MDCIKYHKHVTNVNVLMLFKIVHIFVYRLKMFDYCRAKQMLEQIDKILKSNWSSSWFQKASSQIGPKFKNEQPVNNLNSMNDQVLKILLNNTNYPGYDEIGRDAPSTLGFKDLAGILGTRSSSPKRNGTTSSIRVATLNRNGRLHSILVERSNMSEDLFDRLERANLSVDSDELVAFLIEQMSMNDEYDLNQVTISRSKRLDLMRSLFCDRDRFVKIVHLRTTESTRFSFLSKTPN